VAFRRVAASIIVGERSIAVRRPCIQAIADERRRNAVPAPDLEDTVIEPDLQLLDQRSQPLAHFPDDARRHAGSRRLAARGWRARA